MALSLKNSQAAVLKAISAGLAPLLLGQPGAGKSDMMKKIAKDLNLELIDIRLAQCEPTDLLGFPSMNHNTGKASYMPMDIFPLENDKLPEGKSGWLMFLDELPNANTHVQLAAYRLILDREVGNNKLHPAVKIVAAGNREIDECFVQPMPKALKSRMVHLEVELNANDWIDYAIKADLDYRVTSFIAFDKTKLHTEYADSDEATYACPRTWEFTSRLIDGETNLSSPVMRNLLNGTISSATTSEFLAYVKYFDKLPTYEEVVAKPKTCTIADKHDIGLIWATIAMLNANFELKDLAEVMVYVERLPEEYQLLFVKYLTTKYPQDVLSHPVMQPWISKIVNMLWS